MGKDKAKSIPPKFPPLEKIYNNDYHVTARREDLEVLLRNQEKIYQLLQELTNKICEDGECATFCRNFQDKHGCSILEALRAWGSGRSKESDCAAFCRLYTARHGCSGNEALEAWGSEG